MSIHMGIPRYDIYERPGDDDPLDECARGRVVLYSDHLADKQAALDAQQAAHAAEVERLTAERDKLQNHLEEADKIAFARESAFVAERDVAVRERDAAVEALRHLYDLHAHGVFYVPDEYYVAITNAVAVLSSPPADASKMGGERCDTCQHDPDTCDRAECPAWGKSEDEKKRILIREANRPLTDEEHAIVDAGYERGKRILAEVKAEERERQYMEALAAYANDEDRYNRGDGEPYGSIQVEVGAIARQARAALAEMEQKS